MDLPVYELKIDEAEDSFVSAIAIVDKPAIESSFIAFSKEQHKLTFSIDEDKQELIGAAMIPDQLIYRKAKDGREYNVFFSKDTIRSIAQVYFKNGFQKNINLDHTEVDADSFVYQSYIVDESKGMNSPVGLNLVDGSWVVGVKVNNPEVFADIKAGKRTGFSVEGIFQHYEAKFESENNLLELVNSINKLIEKL